MRKILTLLAIVTLFSCTKDLGGYEPPVNVPLSTTLSGTYKETTYINRR